jgi:hypothetical protein
MGNLTSLKAALDRRGRTNLERAVSCGIKIRRFYDLKRGRLHPQVQFFMHNPDLLEALLEDARAGRTNGNHD